MTSHEHKTLLEKWAQPVCGNRVWHIGAGPSTGSHFTMEIGNMIPRKVPIANSALPEIARTHQGEFQLYMNNAAWRVERVETNEVVTTWMDNNELCGVMLRGLDLLLGNKVVSCQFDCSFGDFCILFSSGLALYSMSVSPNQGGNDYTLFCESPSKTKWIAVGPHGVATINENLK